MPKMKVRNNPMKVCLRYQRKKGKSKIESKGICRRKLGYKPKNKFG